MRVVLGLLLLLSPALAQPAAAPTEHVIVTGTTTSGCVRATVIDAFSLNFRVAVAEEGCFDRSQASHAINLCDMHAKYADVVKTAEVLDFFESLPHGLFELPRGTAPALAKAANA